MNIRPYRNESTDPRHNAQRNLDGRTFYVRDDTLRFHKSRVLASGVAADGLIFWLIESTALDMHNTRRGFRFALFDVFGTCLDRPSLDESYRTRKRAEAAMRAALAKIDAKAHTRRAARDEVKHVHAAIDELLSEVK
jgi:hypothetical protein